MKQFSLAICVLLSSLSVLAQDPPQEAQVPTLVKFSASVQELDGSIKPGLHGLRFAFYKDENGGAPLWMETQNVTLDNHGRFTVFLGSMTVGGVSSQMFLSGELRWVGITPDDGTERARILFTSVPYSLKAADADLLGGRAASDFVSQEQLRLALNPQDITVHGVGIPPQMGSNILVNNGSSGAPSRESGWSDPSPIQQSNPVGTRPPGKATSANSPTNKRNLQAGDNWLVGAIAIKLASGVQSTVTLTPCPLGIDTSASPLLGGPNGGYPIRIVDGTKPATRSETVYVTGGTCTSAAESGTIIFSPYFSHTKSTYTLGSASSGIQEAINDACGTNTTPYENGGCSVVIPATGPQVGGPSGYDIYDTIYFHANGSVLSGYGAILNCHERGPCIQVGDLSNANDYDSNVVEGFSFRSIDNRQSDPAFNGSLIQSTQRIGGTITVRTAAAHNLRTGDRVTQMLTDSTNYWGDVPSIVVTDEKHYTYTRLGAADIPVQVNPGLVGLSYEAVLDNGNSTSLVDLAYESTYENGAFNHFFDFWDDENAQIQKFDNNAIPLNSNANWTGSFVWSGGSLGLPDVTQQLAPVITVDNSSFTANGSNCATIYNSNGFYFQNSVCQAQGPWEFLVSDSTGNYQGADFQNIFSEAAVSLNPASPVRSPWPGLGVAGFIGGPVSGAGGFTLSGQGSFGGALPVVGTGSTTYVYYVVARDVTLGYQTSPLPFMYEQENSPSNVTVQWPRVAAGTDVIVYDVIRNPAPFGSMFAATGDYVAPYNGGCTGGSNTACGSVAVGLAQCSGLVCKVGDNTAKATSAYQIGNGNFAPNPSFWPGTAVLSSTPLQSVGEVAITGVAFNGGPSQYASYCSDFGANVSGGYTVCSGSQTESNNSVPDQPPFILTDGNTAGGGGLLGAKGRLIFETTANSAAVSHQVITIYDSNPAKTQATTGHRPVGDPGDMYLGIDPNAFLMIGGGAKGIAQYINNIGDGVNIEELLTSSLKTFNVPVLLPQIRTGNPLNTDLGGIIVLSGSTSASYTFTRTYTLPPICVLTALSDPTPVGEYWATITNTSLTANVNISGSIAFNYACLGH
jgi:hypothetical protein